MKVLLKKNLGSRDCAALGLEFAKCRKGNEVAASDDVCESLVKRGLATLVDEPVKEVRAVPPETVKAVPSSSTMKGK